MILKIYKPFFIEVIEVFDLEELQRYLILLERVNSKYQLNFTFSITILSYTINKKGKKGKEFLVSGYTALG